LLWGAEAWDAAAAVSYTPVAAAVSAPTASAPPWVEAHGEDTPTGGDAASDDGSVVYDTAGRLRIGDFIDVAVVETVTPDEDGTIRPSTVRGAALADLPGVAATVYIMHAGGPAPGTALTGPDGGPVSAVGEAVVLPDGGTAVVTSTFVASKDETGELANAAFAVPANVVVITCRAEGAPVSTSNVVVVAERVRT